MSVSTTDRAAANLATISEIYAAFGRGDIPFILDRISPECRWESWTSNYAQVAGLPTMKALTGPAGVSDFFLAVAQLNIQDFQVLDALASQHQVVAEVVIAYSTPAGGRLRDEELHLWTLDERQSVVRMRHYVDTAKHIAAFAGEDTTG